MPRSRARSRAAASTPKRWSRRSWRSASPSRPGASAPAARALPAFPAPASRATSSTSSTIARPSSSSCARRRPISPHFPWDATSDYAALRETAAARGLAFDAVNSNTFQDQPGQKLSYKFGSLSHVDDAVRAQAVAHNIECIEIGRQARLESADGLDRRRLQFRRPIESDARARSLSRLDARGLRRAARRLARVPRAQALRARLLFDGDLRLGHELRGRAGARPQGAMPRRSRPSRAQRQYRADRRAPRALQEARAASISTIRNMATTISTPARSNRSACSWSSTN